MKYFDFATSGGGCRVVTRTSCTSYSKGVRAIKFGLSQRRLSGVVFVSFLCGPKLARCVLVGDDDGPIGAEELALSTLEVQQQHPSPAPPHTVSRPSMPPRLQTVQGDGLHQNYSVISQEFSAFAELSAHQVLQRRSSWQQHQTPALPLATAGGVNNSTGLPSARLFRCEGCKGNDNGNHTATALRQFGSPSIMVATSNGGPASVVEAPAVVADDMWEGLPRSLEAAPSHGPTNFARFGQRLGIATRRAVHVAIDETTVGWQTLVRAVRDNDGLKPIHSAHDVRVWRHYGNLAQSKVDQFHLVVAYSVLFVLAFVFFYFNILAAPSSVEEALEEGAEQLAHLCDSYDKIAQSYDQKVKSITSKHLEWAQSVFSCAKHDFIEWLRVISKNPARLGGDEADGELLEPIRLLIKGWLGILKECSYDPDLEPLIVVEEPLLNSLSTLSELCKFVADVLESVKIEFTHDLADNQKPVMEMWQVDGGNRRKGIGRQEQLQRLKELSESGTHMCSWADCLGLNKRYQAIDERTLTEDQLASFFPFEVHLCSRCCCSFARKLGRVKFFSSSHLFYFIFTVILIGAVFESIKLEFVVGSIASGVSVALMVVVLFQVENHDVKAQMQKSQGVMQETKDKMSTKKEDLDDLYKAVNDPSVLWMSRTRPQLDIFRNLCRKIIITRWPSVASCKAFVQRVNQAVERMKAGFGDLALWSNTSVNSMCLSDEAMGIMQREAERVAQLINTSSTRVLNDSIMDWLEIPSMLSVRVIRCKQLSRGRLYMSSGEPFVQLRATQGGEWLKTDRAKDWQNPSWTVPGGSPPTFHLTIDAIDAAELEVEVMAGGLLGPDTYVGGLTIPLDAFGQGSRKWKTLTLALEDNNCGSVVLEIFFSRDARGLAVVFPSDKELMGTKQKAKSTGMLDFAKGSVTSAMTMDF
eukprot:TRINITY_DN49810_c0_g1_i1.p1 TRINITY_DN49810_c0_g1~~TRINITY_DN49810_c0_g1_i1.p1  ORF type:complete len:924 (-),score=146.74 TRINITY_DN49810_c0_g1_i1:457-3228(-)